MQYIRKHIESSRAAASASESGKVTQNKLLVDNASLLRLSYGLFLITVKDGDKDNGCIIKTAVQITVSPLRIAVILNKANLTHHMVLKTGEFAVSVLTESTPFHVIEHFGFRSGKDTDKFAGYEDVRTNSGFRYLPEHSNSVICAKMTEFHDYGTHTLFIADVVQAYAISDEPSATYQYYFDHIKP